MLGNLNMMAFYVFFNYVRNQDLKKVQTISVSQDSDQTTNDWSSIKYKMHQTLLFHMS